SWNLPAGPRARGPEVILTGEYTPFNLLYQGGKLSAMFDFGDGLVGPREYDWLGPMCFLAAGDASRLDAFFDGYHGRPFDRGRREAPAAAAAAAPLQPPEGADRPTRLAGRTRLRHAGRPDLAVMPDSPSPADRRPAMKLIGMLDSPSVRHVAIWLQALGPCFCRRFAAAPRSSGSVRSCARSGSRSRPSSRAGRRR
ncbi:MAG: phosphotransferase, partial [Betaproteobacteria bacterium]|nr:phosphotransferase [Betaproteobacteria bacterium]